MRQPWRCRFLHVGIAVLGVVAVVACASTGGPSAKPDQSVDTSRKTQQQVQSELMAFADRFFAETLESAKNLESILATPESRYIAAGARVLALVVTTDIAASPNPGAAVLDMAVYVTLKRIVWEEYWMPEVYGDGAQPVLESFLRLEDDIWEIAAGVYSDAQLDQLRALIDDWRVQHPDTEAVDFVRLAELGHTREVKDLMEAGRPGGMLAPVKDANRNLEEMRLLAERLTFMVTRMQLLISLQVEMATAKLATQPEARQLLEDSRAFTEASDLAAEAFAELVADLPEERRAAIAQVLNGLREERERIFAELGDDDGRFRSAVADLHQTLATGQVLAVDLGSTVRDIDVLVARMMAGNPKARRPFDILEYQATFAELTVTVSEMQAVLASVERILGAAANEDDLDPLFEAVNRLEDEVVDEIIDRAFLRGVALIVIFFICLAIYRLFARRVTRDSGNRLEAAS